jgi:adenylate cyclase
MAAERPAPRLRDLDRCFQGEPPASLATCSPEGIPNVTYLSIVHRIGDSHVALSFQFFNKSRENIQANPRAQVLMVDPVTMVQYRLSLAYERTELEGPLFEAMRTNLDAVASQTGMTGVFRLRGVDIYRVHDIEELAHDLDLSSAEGSPDFLTALEALSTQLAACDDLEALLDTTLRGLDELFGYRHSMILFADETGESLYAVGSRGFPSSGVGAEIRIGEGLIGIAAAERRPVRMANFRMEQVLAGAIRSTAQDHGHELAHAIPLPGLPDVKSQIAVPILARDRLLGVVCVQSAQAGSLAPGDEQALSTLARYLATSILLLGVSAEDSSPRPPARRPSGTRGLQIRYHSSDDSVFLDEEYLIKGLPGRILVRLLAVYEQDGRVDFTNKELRADDSLQLSDYRDNLEARLILLRRRLEERTDALRLTRSGRGRFRLEVTRPFQLVRR